MKTNEENWGELFFEQLKKKRPKKKKSRKLLDEVKSTLLSWANEEEDSDKRLRYIKLSDKIDVFLSNR